MPIGTGVGSSQRKAYNGPRRVPVSLSRRRALLYLAAVLFGGTTAFYSIVWMYYAPQSGATRIGAEFAYSFASRALRVTRVVPGRNAEQAGLRAGDEILAINNAKLDTLTPYYEAVGRGTVGDTVNFSVRRIGEVSLRVVPVVLESPRPLEMYRNLTPSRMAAIRLMMSYPILFLVVGMAVLFLKVEDRNAWLLAVFFASFIAIPDLPPGLFPRALRGSIMTYHVVLASLAGAALYGFLAVFPGASPLDRRAPWLKWIFLAGGGISIVLGLWTLAAANAYDTMWLPLEYGGPSWVNHSVHRLGNVLGLGAESLAVVSLVLNSFRGVTPEAQRKARVIVWGLACGLLPIVMLGMVISLKGGRYQEIPFWPYAFCVLALFLLPLSFAYAVVKHRVMEIPLLLRRSARYVLVQRGFVVLMLIVAASAIGIFTHVFSRFVRADTNIGMALSAVFGIVLVWTSAPLVKRGTVRIDRAFFRSAYDSRIILNDLAEKTRSVDDRRQLASLLELHVTEALHPKTLACYLESSNGQLATVSGTFPATLDTLPASAPVFVELAHRGKPWEVLPSSSAGADELAALSPLAPECLVPILGRQNNLIGLLVLGQRLSEEPYSSEDKHLLGSVASHVGFALENIHLAEKLAERMEADRRTAQEMEIARQVQARLFPQKLPAMKTLEYTGACIQARKVGGDYYDFLELRPGRLALVLADIAGKGVSGALLMANLQANLRSQYVMAVDDLPGLLASVNRLFYESTDDASYATLFFADYDDTSRKLRYANCGHLPPLLLRAGGSSTDQVSETPKIEWLRSTCTVMGLFEAWRCEVAEVQLAPCDTLVLYTDGITEATNSAGEEFGESHLLDTLKSHPHLPVRSLLQTVVGAVQQFSSEQQDDITLVIARCLG
jgi:sigma-B regulation protein RsbU (phosphoserine phosphatase)